jgi:hypothetical protein
MSENGANGSTNAPINGNGNGKLLWWLIGGIITPLIFTALNTVTGDSKRVTALETLIQNVDRRLERLEDKIEKLLERK